MLVPWPRQATWTTLVAGVTADGLEASRHRESFTFGKIAANSSAIPFDVTDSVQAWVNGAPNHGWVFINTGGNGWDFYTHEFDDVKQRPKLIVTYTPPKSRGTAIAADSVRAASLTRVSSLREEDRHDDSSSPAPGTPTPPLPPSDPRETSFESVGWGDSVFRSARF